MAKNETLSSKEEQQLNTLFSQLREMEVEASPYLKTRVLAHLDEQKKIRRSLLFWKLLSAGSVMSVVIVGFLALGLYQKAPSDGVTKQAYVIHLDFNQADKNLVAHAEVELPQDVHFVSSNKAIQEERKLKLPVQVKEAGRGKLPFVVTSEFSGEKEIKVRLLNEKDELVREQVLKLKFAKQGSTITF